MLGIRKYFQIGVIMNLGIYINNLADHEQLKDICESINTSISSGMVNDASIFYDNVAYNPFNVKCGIFNASDLWNFSGKLIVTSLSSALTSLKIINNIDLIYYYGWENKINPLHLLHLLNHKVTPACKSEEFQHDMYRKTGVKSEIISPTFIGLINNIR